ncbi:hypothetical protein C8R44DRAFT_102560 [Mycena epipterygia]|nr:hypothetical protein C8R44DRAFT_102560 [Mycena epipterygia]
MRWTRSSCSAFENLAEIPRDENADELLGQGGVVFGEVAKRQWDSYCVQYILEHSLDEHLLAGLLEYATNERGSKSVVKVLKEGGKDTLDRVVQSPRRVVDLALSLTASQLIANVLPTISAVTSLELMIPWADKEQCALLYEATSSGCACERRVRRLSCFSIERLKSNVFTFVLRSR